MRKRAQKFESGPTGVVSVRMPLEQREAIEAAAIAAGTSLSAFVAEAMAKIVASNGDLSDSVASLRASASSAAMTAVNSGPAPANDLRLAVNSQPSKPDALESLVYKGAAAAKDVDYAERQASNDELERELAALFEKPSDRSVNTAVYKASATTSAPASAVNNAPPVKISASIPVYGQVPGFTYIGTQTGLGVQNVTDQRVRVPTWQTPSDRPRGGLHLRSTAPTPPSDRSQRLRGEIRQFLFGPDADAPKSNEPLVNPADPAVLYELKRIGNNINQIAHAVNTGLPPSVTLTVQSFRHLFEALTDDVEFRRRLDAIRMRSEFNGTAHPQSRRGLP